MSDWLNGADRWRERQAWLPAWLDNADWKTWLWHAAIAVLAGHVVAVVVFGAFGGLLSWRVALEVSLRAMVVVYAWREHRNVQQLWREGKPLRPLDHAMDVVAPSTAVELVLWGWG